MLSAFARCSRKKPLSLMTAVVQQYTNALSDNPCPFPTYN